MQAKYDKAIAVGMAGILLLFISLYISSSVAGISMDGSDGDELAWGFALVAAIMCTLFIVGFISACVTYGNVSFQKDVVKVSSLAGAVPLSIVTLVIVYLALHAGLSALLAYVAAGLAIIITGILLSAAGGIVGRKILTAVIKQKT